MVAADIQVTKMPADVLDLIMAAPRRRAAPLGSPGV
jgi:hypothetical protein